MTKTMIKSTINNCIQNRTICKTVFNYDDDNFYYFPLIISDKLFLGSDDLDFQLDGYDIRRIKDVVKAQEKDDFYLDIFRKEGIIDNIIVPNIDVTNWESVMRSLNERGKNIIIESDFEKDTLFSIGRIEAIYKNFVYLRHFDGDGIWEDKPIKINYSDIFKVSFDNRYINFYSRNLPPLPVNFRGKK